MHTLVGLSIGLGLAAAMWAAFWAADRYLARRQLAQEADRYLRQRAARVRP